jgi:hypothetical protein
LLRGHSKKNEEWPRKKASQITSIVAKTCRLFKGFKFQQNSATGAETKQMKDERMHSAENEWYEQQRTAVTVLTWKVKIYPSSLKEG